MEGSEHSSHQTGTLTLPYSIKNKIKGKVVLSHAMKAYSGRRGTAPLILNLGTGWR